MLPFDRLGARLVGLRARLVGLRARLVGLGRELRARLVGLRARLVGSGPRLVGLGARLVGSAAAGVRGAAAVDPGQQLFDHLGGHQVVLGRGAGRVPRSHRPIDGHQSRNPVPAEIARPEVAAVVRGSSVVCSPAGRS